MKIVKTNKFYWVLLVIGFVFVTTNSCTDSDLDDVQNKGTFDTDNYFQNEEQVYSVLIGAYDPLHKWAGGFDNFTVLFNAASDNFRTGGGDRQDGNQIQEVDDFTITPDVIPAGHWNEMYHGIARANLLLDRIDQADMDEDTKTRFMAEAKSLRSLYYFQLLIMFRNIPLITDVINAEDDIFNFEQADPEQVYEQIESDLLAAAPDLPKTVSGDERGRFTEGAARALLGKIYLYDEKNEKAAEQLKEVNGTPGSVSQYGYKLLDDWNDLWDPEKTDFNQESILEVVHTDKSNNDWGFWGGDQDEGNTFIYMIGPRNYNRISDDAPDLVNGYGFDLVEPELNKFMEGDPRKDRTILNVEKLQEEGKATYQDAYEDTGYYLNKFLRTRDRISTRPGALELNFRQNFMIIRLADTYLMEAEALGAQGPRAQALLDAVRERVGLPSVPVSMQAIKDERRKELAGEGQRFFDLVRWGDAGSALGDKGFVEGKNEILPIPEAETEGTEIKQNPGY